MRELLRHWLSSPFLPPGETPPQTVPFPESGLSLPQQFAWHLVCRSRSTRLIEWPPPRSALSIWHCKWPGEVNTGCPAPDARPTLAHWHLACKTNHWPSLLRAEPIESSVVLISGLGASAADLQTMARTARYLLLCVDAPASDGGQLKHEFEQLACRLGIQPSFSGGFRANGHILYCALGGREATVPALPKPAKALALMTTYNEEDIVEQAVADLFRQGLDVFVVDDNSSDGTVELLEAIARSSGRLFLDRDSRSHASRLDKKALFDRLLMYAHQAVGNGYSWMMYVDPDELRRSPWPDVSLAEAFAHVESYGYNAVDFTVIDFRYAQGQRMTSAPYEEQMRHFEFGLRPGHFQQIKAWRHSPQIRTDLFAGRGHEAVFEGRRVFPLKFLLKHYPLRGREHARRKIYRDRFPRYDPAEVAKGAHVQYNAFRDRDPVGWDLDGLPRWDENFYSRFLLERLSGIGLNRS